MPQCFRRLFPQVHGERSWACWWGYAGWKDHWGRVPVDSFLKVYISRVWFGECLIWPFKKLAMEKWEKMGLQPVNVMAPLKRKAVAGSAHPTGIQELPFLGAGWWQAGPFREGSWCYRTLTCFVCAPECVWFSSPRFLVQFRQDKVCVKFIQGAQKNGSVPTCKRKNNRLLEVAVPWATDASALMGLSLHNSAIWFCFIWGLAVCLGVAKGKLLESFGKIKSIWLICFNYWNS